MEDNQEKSIAIKSVKRGSLILVKKQTQVTWAVILGKDIKKKKVNIYAFNFKQDSSEKQWATSLTYESLKQYLSEPTTKVSL